MIGILGLDQHFARTFGATGSSRDLHDALCQTLCSAKVDAEQTLIGIEYDYQGHVGKVMSLRQHLRSNQQSRFAGLDTCKGLLQIAFVAHTVTIDSRSGNLWKKFLERCLDSFSPFT